MKRSTVNQAIREAAACFHTHHWALPPQPRWDVTDFGLGNFAQYGLILVNLAEEPEYCEKLMYARPGQRTPAHTHGRKKEDIIVRVGQLAVQVWEGRPKSSDTSFSLQRNGLRTEVRSGEILRLNAGERITLVPGIYHEFWPLSTSCIIGEVSTHNDDLHDNFFVNPEVGRFSEMEEDEPAEVKLVSD